MKLTRRDALSVLAGVGIVGGASGAGFARLTDAEDTDPPAPASTLETLVAAAEVVYPSGTDGIPEFVETYSLGRIQDRESYREGVDAATAELDTHAQLWFNTDTFAGLPVSERDDLLHQMGVHTAAEQPDGTIAERVRYYVVNELLYAFYTSPTGGELVGIENPIGHPGGTQSYQRGPR